MPNGYDPSAFPTSFNDPAYAQADQAAASAVGIPPQMLTNVRTKGERSNADQISSAGASTVYQITPGTRQAIISQTGIDPYLNLQTAAYGAAYLLKQSMDRNGGNPVLAVAEYHGGTDQANWGPRTMAYVKRTTGFTPNSYQQGSTPNPFQVQPLPDIGSAPGAVGSTPTEQQGSDPYAVQPLPNIGSGPGANSNAPSALSQAYQAYKNGQMQPQDAAQFEQDVSAGRIVLPAGMDVKAPQASPADNLKVAQIAPQQIVDAYNAGQMSPQDAKQFEQDTSSGALALPPGVTLNPPQPGAGRTAGVAARGYLEGLGQTVGGVIDRAKGIIDAPISAVNAIANPLGAIDQALGTHLAPPQPLQPIPTQQTGIGATQAAPALPSMEQSAQAAVNTLGLPVAQTPGERVVQEGVRGAGMMTAPFPGAPLRVLPAMIAAGATGSTAGEVVYQHTGNHALGLVANLLTTALSPVAASRVMSALAKELPAEAAAGARVEPSMPPQTGETPAAEPAQPAGQTAQPAAQEGAQATATPESAPTPSAQSEAAPAASTQVGEPPVPAGMTRLYHGSATPGRYEGPAWFSTNRDYAANYRGPEAELQYVDYPTAKVNAALDPDGYGNTVEKGFTWNKELDSSETGARKSLGTAGEANGATPAASIPGVQPVNAAGQQAVEQSAARAAEGAPAAGQTETATPLVPDDPEQRAQIIKLMQNASGQNKTISAGDVQAARNELLARFRIDPQAVDSARDLGMLDDLHPDHLATDIQMIKLNQLLKSDPSNPMAAQEAANLTRVGQRAIGLFNEMGAAPDISALSQKANQMLGEQNNSLKGEVKSILDEKIPSMVPKNSQVPAANALAMINDELENLGGKSQLLSRDWRRAQGLLSPVDEPVSAGGQQIPGSKVGIAPTNPTYHAVDTLRKQLNAADRGVGPFVNMEQASRRQLAQALSKDQGAYLESASSEAHALWKQANAKVQMYKAVQDDMQTLFGKSTEQSMLPTMKNAIQGLSSGNVENFTRVISAIPKSMRNEVLTTTLQNMFTRAGANELGPFGFEQFSRFWRSIKQDSASYSAIMANLEPEARATLSKLITVSDRISGSISQKIYTGRSRFAKDLVAELNDVPTTMIDRIRSAVGPAAGNAVGGAASYAAHHIPVVGPVVAPMMRGVGNIAAWAITPNKTPVEKALSDFILSDEARPIIEKGPAANDQEIRTAANSSTLRQVITRLNGAVAANDPVARERWLRGIVNAAGQLSESNTNKSR